MEMQKEVKVALEEVFFFQKLKFKILSNQDQKTLISIIYRHAIIFYKKILKNFIMHRPKFSKIPSSNNNYPSDNPNQNKPPSFYNNDHWNKGAHYYLSIF